VHAQVCESSESQCLHLAPGLDDDDAARFLASSSKGLAWRWSNVARLLGQRGTEDRTWDHGIGMCQETEPEHHFVHRRLSFDPFALPSRETRDHGLSRRKAKCRNWPARNWRAKSSAFGSHFFAPLLRRRGKWKGDFGSKWAQPATEHTSSWRLVA